MKQTEILTFIRAYVLEHGYAPSVREIAAGVGLSSTATVHTHLKNLVANGHITMDRGPRTIVLRRQLSTPQDADAVTRQAVQSASDNRAAAAHSLGSSLPAGTLAASRQK